jgi:hypothetical protein
MNALDKLLARIRAAELAAKVRLRPGRRPKGSTQHPKRQKGRGR